MNATLIFSEISKTCYRKGFGTSLMSKAVRYVSQGMYQYYLANYKHRANVI